MIGVASDGLHSNGFSLARKVLLEQRGPRARRAHYPELGEPLVDALLRPTRMYVQAPRSPHCATGGVKALCHITGGGLPGNLPRVLPDGLGAELDARAWSGPAIFELHREARTASSATRCAAPSTSASAWSRSSQPARAGAVLAVLAREGERASDRRPHRCRCPGDTDRVRFV